MSRKKRLISDGDKEAIKLGAQQPVTLLVENDGPRDFDAEYQEALAVRRATERLTATRTEESAREHPTTTLFRVGIESVCAGEPVREFLELLLRVAKQAHVNDVLAKCLPDEFAHRRSPRLNKTIDDRDRGIAEKFAHMLSTLEEGVSYQAAKRKFCIDIEGDKSLGCPKKKTVDRALAKYNVGAHAYASKR